MIDEGSATFVNDFRSSTFANWRNRSILKHTTLREFIVKMDDRTFLVHECTEIDGTLPQDMLSLTCNEISMFSAETCVLLENMA